MALGNTFLQDRKRSHNLLQSLYSVDYFRRIPEGIDLAFHPEARCLPTAMRVLQILAHTSDSRHLPDARTKLFLCQEIFDRDILKCSCQSLNRPLAPVSLFLSYRKDSCLGAMLHLLPAMFFCL